MLPLLNILLNGLFIQVWLPINVYEEKCVRLVSDFFFKMFSEKDMNEFKLISRGMLIYQMVIWRLGHISISFWTSGGWWLSRTWSISGLGVISHLKARGWGYGHLKCTRSIWRMGLVLHSLWASEGWGLSQSHLEYLKTGGWVISHSLGVSEGCGSSYILTLSRNIGRLGQSHTH